MLNLLNYCYNKTMKMESINIHKIESYKTVPDRIADALIDGILKGTLKGGTPLKQDEIAKKFSVSLIPVREALIQLESIGLVNCIPNKGAVVAPLSIEEMQMIFELREILEQGAAKAIIKGMNSTHLEKLRQLSQEMEEEEDLYVFNRLNTQFHQVLCDCGGNIALSKSYHDLFVRVERYCVHIIKDPAVKTAIRLDHKEILTCIEKEDVKTLSDKLLEHAQKKEKLFREYILHKYGTHELNWNDL